MATTTSRWDIQDHLTSPERMAGYLEAAFEDGDPGVIAAAIGDYVRARGMSKVATDTGLTREGLSKALSATGNPRLTTLVPVLAALGLRLAAVPIDTVEAA